MSDPRSCARCGAMLSDDPGDGLCPGCLMRQALGGESSLGISGSAIEPETTSPDGPGSGALPGLPAGAAVGRAPSVSPWPETTVDHPGGGAEGAIDPGRRGRASSGERVPEPPRRFGDYVIDRLISRGGMGVVYRARQQSLNREVALKMIRSAHLAGPSEVRRFLAEAEAVANLDHPNIVPIYEVGAHRGQHYFSMKLIEGGNLSHRVAELVESPRDSARLLAVVARAVHHAHRRGVLHRDLKPDNILIDREGRPLVTDFGIAKRLKGAPAQTRTGALMGTPPYMAPEQADRNARDVTTSADVYGLGAILYETLTGRPPFRGDSLIEILRQVVEDEPTPPRALNDRVDRDLEAICLKCLEKQPGRRYGSAMELAEDLERWSRGEPILARPVGKLEQAWRWARRHRAISAVGVTAAASLVVVTALSTISAAWIRSEQRVTLLALRKSERAERQAEQAARLAEQRLEAFLKAKREAEAERGRARGLAEIADERDRQVKTLAVEADRMSVRVREEAKLARIEREKAEEAERLLRQRTYQGKLRGAYRFLTESIDVGQAGELLSACLPGQREWSWAYCDRLRHPELFSMDGHVGPVLAVSYRPDGRVIATSGLDHTVRLWDAGDGRPIEVLRSHGHPVRDLAFDPESGDLASADDSGAIAVWEPGGGARSPRQVFQAGGPVRCLDYNASGGFLASGLEDGRVLLWNPRHGLQETLQTFFVERDNLVGRIEPGQSRPPKVTLTDARSFPMPFLEVARHSGPVLDVSFSKAPRIAAQTPFPISIVSSGADSMARGSLVAVVEDRRSREEQRLRTDPEGSGGSGRPKGSGNPPRKPSSKSNVEISQAPNAAGASAVGALLGEGAVGGFGQMSPEDFEQRFTGDLVEVRRRYRVDPVFLRPHPESVGALASFTRTREEGPLLISGSRDRAVRLFDARSGSLLKTFMGNTRQINALGLSPDGRWVASAGGDGTIWRWRLDGSAADRARGHVGEVHAVAISPDGTRFASAGEDGTARVWDATGGQESRRLDGPGQPVASVAFDRNPERPLLASGGSAPFVSVWDAASGDRLRSCVGLTAPVQGLAFGRRGARTILVAACVDGSIPVWVLPEDLDSPSGRRSPITPEEILRHPGRAFGVALSGDARRLACAGSNGTVLVFEDGAEEPARSLIHPSGIVRDVAFSPDGSRLATSSSDGAIRIWDPETSELCSTLEGHEDAALRLSYLPDGTRLVSAGRDGVVILWDLGSGLPEHVLRGHSGDVLGVGVSPDGRTIASTGIDATLRTWDADSGQELLVLRGHEAAVTSAAFGPSGRWLVSAAVDGSVLRWDGGPGVRGGRDRGDPAGQSP